MQAFVYELISAGCFGVSNAYWKKIDKAGYSFEEAIFYRGFMGVILLSVLWIYLHSTGYLGSITKLDKTIFSDYKWLYTLLICLFCSFGLVLQLRTVIKHNTQSV